MGDPNNKSQITVEDLPDGVVQLSGIFDADRPIVLIHHEMAKPLRIDAEEARNQLPDLLTAAQHGLQTIITRHGWPVAALTPVSATGEANAQRSLLPLAGSGRGMYGRDTQVTVRRLRDE